MVIQFILGVVTLLFIYIALYSPEQLFVSESLGNLPTTQQLIASKHRV